MGYVPGFKYNQSEMGVTETWGPINISETSPFGDDGLDTDSQGTGVLVQIASPTLDNIGLDLAQTETFDKIQVINPDGTTGAVASPTGLDASFPHP